MLMSVGGTLKIRNAELTVPSERGCAGAASVILAAASSSSGTPSSS